MLLMPLRMTPAAPQVSFLTGCLVTPTMLIKHHLFLMSHLNIQPTASPGAGVAVALSLLVWVGCSPSRPAPAQGMPAVICKVPVFPGAS